MLEKQRQEAGDNSQQIQAGTMIINTGIDEKRAREIVDEKLHEVIIGYSQEAHEISENRINLFANDLIPKLVKANLLEGLKDPSIQVLLMEAQRSAASTERAADYALLTELLIHRVQKGSDRNVRAGVNHAVRIVDEITDESLLGLTVAHSILSFSPVSGNIKDGLRVLNDLFGKISYGTLPNGNEWIEHLDVLNAVRINSMGSLKKIEEYYPEQLAGYVDVGIDKTTENFQKAIEIAKEANLPGDILCEHELRPEYVRLKIPNINDLDFIAIHYQSKFNLPVKTALTKKQTDAIRSIYALYSNDADLKNQNIREFIKIWNELENLKELGIWWDAIPLFFTITPVGRVLAHANAQRCDPTLPELN